MNQNRKLVALLMVIGALVGACSTSTDSSNSRGVEILVARDAEGRALTVRSTPTRLESQQQPVGRRRLLRRAIDADGLRRADNKPHPTLAKSLTPNAFTQWTMTLAAGDQVPGRRAAETRTPFRPPANKNKRRSLVGT